MSRITIWGYNPAGVPWCYALNVDSEDEPFLLGKAQEEGWTGLLVDKNPQPTLWPDDESASSASPTSTPKK